MSTPSIDTTAHPISPQLTQVTVESMKSDDEDDDESESSSSEEEEHVHGPNCDHYEYPSDADNDNSTYSFHVVPTSNKKYETLTPPQHIRQPSLSGRVKVGRKRLTRCQLIMKETALLLKLGWILYSNLGVMGKWVIMLTRLCLFAVFLIPAWCKLVKVYFTDKCILKNIKYGSQARNYLDLYLPTVCYDYLNRQLGETPRNLVNPKKPVVIFMTGGAWTIGYKGWGGLVGISLKPKDIIVVIPDYRNFPQGVVPDMINDTRQAVWWVYQHIHLYGGDRKSIYLVGQSAGAHISLLTIVEQAKAEAKRGSSHSHHLRCKSNPPSPTTSSFFSPRSQKKMSDSIINNNIHSNANHTWKCSIIRGVIGVSGPYDLVMASEYFHTRGLHQALFSQIMNGSYECYSPTLMVRDLAYYWNISSYQLRYEKEDQRGQLCENVEPLPPFDSSNPIHLSSATSTRQSTIACLPPILLLHGRSDRSVLWQQSQSLYDALVSVGANVNIKYYEGLTHTDPILENPMSGSDPLMHDVTSFIHQQQCQPPLTRRQRTSSVISRQLSHDFTELLNTCDTTLSSRETSPSTSISASAPSSASTSPSNLDPSMVDPITYDEPVRALAPHILIQCARFVNPF